MKKITYAITACNEYEELRQLLTLLLKYTTDILVQVDSEKVTDRVLEVCNTMSVDVHFFPLKNDFATFKNNLFGLTNSEYIFQLDADELPNDWLLENMAEILDLNGEAELIYVPRINTVEGLTRDYIEKWKWRINEKGWVNFPDYQGRIYKNDYNKVHWSGVVHERIVCDVFAALPPEEIWCIYHHKALDRQIRQNAYYDTL